MKKYLGLQHILSNIRKAIDTYNMIDEGDKVAVALSRWKRFNNNVSWFKAFTNFLSKTF